MWEGRKEGREDRKWGEGRGRTKKKRRQKKRN